MSDNIPFEMQTEILKRVHPVKSLIQFRSVSKQWKSLIDSSKFIADHSVNHTHPHRLLLSFHCIVDDVKKYVSVVDDNTFPHHRYHPSPLPQDISLARSVSMIDCSHGLVCLCLRRQDEEAVVIWNPSIRKYVSMLLPLGSSVVGFGVCPETNDTKIVRVMAPVNNTVDWQAEVFTLGTGTWRSISMNMHFPHMSTRFSDNQVVIDGVIHWVTCDLDTRSNNVIVSFDLTSEEFGTVDLPDSLAQCRALSIFKRKGSLVVIKYHMDDPICEVWAMIKNGDSKSLFTKLYDVTFKGTYDTLSYKILGFRKNGELMTEHIYRDDGVLRTTLKGSEPGSEHGDVIEMDVACNSIPWMASYTESLLLLNHSDSIAM